MDSGQNNCLVTRPSFGAVQCWEGGFVFSRPGALCTIHSPRCGDESSLHGPRGQPLVALAVLKAQQIPTSSFGEVNMGWILLGLLHPALCLWGL